MALIQLGSTGPEVLTLQKRLNAGGYSVAVDGNFGPQTDAAVRKYQDDHQLVIDGIVGNKTLAAITGKDTSHLLSQKHLESAAAELGVDIATVFAVKNVESRGEGFLEDGRPVILYERHIMRRRLSANGFSREKIAQICVSYPGLVNKETGGYRGYAAEHARLKNAIRHIDRASALESCSWGLFQIMGYHWELLGYASVSDFTAAMTASESCQFDAFVRFLKTDADMLAALQAKDWAGFAKRYNGTGYKKNQYDTRLAAAYSDYQGKAQEQAA